MRHDRDRFNIPSHALAQSAYEVPADSPWLANLAALWKVDPDLARTLEQFELAQSESSRGNHSLPTGPTGDDERGSLPSDDELRTHFAWMLEGLGPDAQRFITRTGGDRGEPLAVVYEPDLRRIVGVLANVDLSCALESARLVLMVEADLDWLLHRFAKISLQVAYGFRRCENAGARKRIGAELDQVEAMLRELSEHHFTNLNTTVRFGRKSNDNFLANLAHFVRSPGINRLHNAFAGKPAVLVAAGPSLQRNIHQLRGTEDRVVIIAVQTTLKPLLDAGITPHFVCAIDHHEISARFYENLPADLTTELIADPKTSDAVITAWLSQPGRKLSLLGNDFGERLLREQPTGKYQMEPASTVAHLAFQLADYFGCDRCILMGQDLGFSNGLCYSPGTSYDDVWRGESGRFCHFEMKQWEQIARDRNALKRLVDWRGRSMYTEQRLFTYLRQFEQMFAATRMKVIDSTEGGVAKKHTTPMPLADALADCRETIDAVPPHAGYDDKRLEPAADCLVNRIEEAERIAALSRETADQLEVIAQSPGEVSTVNRAVGKIDALRRELRSIETTYKLATLMTQATERDRIMSDLRIRAAEATGVDTMTVRRLRVERDLANVKAIEAAAQQLAAACQAADHRLRTQLSSSQLRHSGVIDFTPASATGMRKAA